MELVQIYLKNLYKITLISNFLVFFFSFKKFATWIRRSGSTALHATLKKLGFSNNFYSSYAYKIMVWSLMK